MSNQPMRVRVWDLPTRLFHWTLAACVICSIASANIGGDAMVWHFRFGYVAFALLVFRIVWGLIGGRWSRFASFVYAPSTIARYLKGRHHAGEHLDVGHNPLGAFSVFALLALLALQVGTGLFADDEIANTGPLIKFVSGSTSLALTKWHKLFGQWLIIALAVMHIAAIVYYRTKKKVDLIGPMLQGDKALPGDVPAALDNAGTRLLALLLILLSAGLVTWVVSLGS